MKAHLLGKLLSIKPNEWEGVSYLFLVLLVFSFGASFARSISMALLVEKVGGDKLPHMFILIDLTVMIGFILYAHYTKKFSGINIFKFFLMSTAIFSIIVQALFFWWAQQKWVYGFFFVGFSFFFILISIHSSSIVASYFTAIQVKRVTPIINAGFPIGGILGGTTLFVLLKLYQFQPQQLIGILSGACLGAFLLLRIIKTRLTPVRTTDPQFRGNKNPINEMIAAFKYVTASKLMIFMSLGLILFVIGNKLLEYHYQTLIYFEIFEDTTERTAFFAFYEIFANLAWLFIQLFITSRVVIRMGVGASNMLYPIFSTLVALALFIYFYAKSLGHIQDSTMSIMLILGIATQFINQEMRWALRTPANNLLFNAIEPNFWGSHKAFLNGIVFPLSTFIAGGLLILITEPGIPGLTLLVSKEKIQYLLPLIVIIVSLLGIIVAFPQWVAYDIDMFNSLNRKLFEPQKISGKPSNSLKQMIQQKLNNTDPYQVTVVLEMIRVLRMNEFVNQVGNLLLRTQVFQVKKHCINTLATLPQTQDNQTYLVEALQTEKEAKVLPLILKELAQFQSVNLNDTIEKLLIHPSPLVFVEACLCLHAHPKYSRKYMIENKIIARIKDSKLRDTELYLYALGELHQAHYSDIVKPYFEHKKSEVRVAAFTAFICMLEGELLEAQKYCLIKALKLPDKEIKIITLRALKECKPLEDWEPVIEILGERDRTVVTESKELLRLNLKVCKKILVDHLFVKKISEQQRFEILSLIYPKLDDNQLQHLQQGAIEAFKKFVQVNGLLKLHELNEYSSEADDLIAKILQEIAEDYLHHVLTIITFASEQNIEFYQRVSLGLLSLSRANQGNALEVLSNAREKCLSSQVLKYFDERVSDLKGIRRIYLVLFNEYLKIDQNRYYSQLLALEHDMLKACLLYIEQEKTGRLKLKNTNQKVRHLLT